MKYNTPRIKLVDIDSNIYEKLIDEGFNVSVGTFGCKYSVSKDTECSLNGNLDGLTETDVVIIDLQDHGEVSDNPLKEKQWLLGDRHTLSSRGSGEYFYPQNLYALQYQKDFHNILLNGKVVVVFAARKKQTTYNIVQIKDDTRYAPESELISNYDWIPDFYSNVKDCVRGNQITLEEKEMLDSIFKGCEHGVTYDTTFGIYETTEQSVLCKSALGETIGFIKSYGDDNFGYLVILPQVEDQYQIIKNLLVDFLPEISGELFPDFVKNTWVKNDDYLLPEIKQLIDRKKEITAKYEKNIVDIDLEIVRIEKEYDFLINILTSDAFSDYLVKNVIKTLGFIGFNHVIDVDEEVEGNRQEDLRIEYDNLIAIIEVKGHNGNPTEDDCQALLKYINRNMKKYSRTDIHGILIVNHQKMKEPKDRTYPAFTVEQIDDAIRDEYTLVSTYELYKACRLMQEGFLDFEEIKKELFTVGLFCAIPKTWQYIGKIQKMFKEKTVACVVFEGDSISIGNELIIENGNDYFTQSVIEMMVEGESKDVAVKGDKLSLKVDRPIRNSSNIYIRN